jgi:hypothetical protein
MSEDFIFKHRDRLKNHFVNVSKVLLYGYGGLSDGAKITFQVIDGFDWEDKVTGDSKGYVFPAAETIAKIRNTTVRTIQRHIKELEMVRLITRQRRKYRASVLFIESVSDKEADDYFEILKNSGKRVGEREKEVNTRNDKNVVSKQAEETTKMSVLYIKENEDKENEINVNEDLKNSNRGGKAQSLRDILIHYKLDVSKKKKKLPRILEHQKIIDKDKRDYLASEIAEKLNDQKSLGAFRTIAEKVPEQVIFEVLSSIKETAREGKIRVSRGALFMDIIKGYCESNGINLGFDSKKPARTIPGA